MKDTCRGARNVEPCRVEFVHTLRWHGRVSWARSKRRSAQEKEEHQHLAAAIGKHVIHRLGKPGDLHLVQVRHLWEDHCRVIVLVGAEAACVKVVHSYFLVADLDGNIMESTPRIIKQY
jgi:hypothetical protein